MAGDATPGMEALRREIARLEGRATSVLAPDLRRFPLGHDDADRRLGGGLERGALHEVLTEIGADAPSAAGFGCGIAIRAAQGRPIVWIRQDFAALETGETFPPGLAEWGLDLSRLVVVHAPKVLDVLTCAAEALACRAVGALIVEFWGEAREFDLTAGRKLLLTASDTGVTAILLRFCAESRPSAAQTRWVVRPARSRSALPFELGHPVFDAALVRARDGATGRWLMEWNAHDTVFKTASAPGIAGDGSRPADSSTSAEAGGDTAHPVVALLPPRPRPGDAAAAGEGGRRRQAG